MKNVNQKVMDLPLLISPYNSSSNNKLIKNILGNKRIEVLTSSPAKNTPTKVKASSVSARSDP
jgi:hypothetical protein